MPSHRERLHTALRGEALDRPLVALWRHFPGDDQHPEELARSAAAFQQTYDWDFCKLTPASSYSTADYGLRVLYHGHPEGTGELQGYPIHTPQDWRHLAPLDPHSGAMGAQLHAIRRTRELIGPDVPLLDTVFCPLAQAKHLIGKPGELLHLRQHPAELGDALELLTETTVRYVRASLAAGADGIFYATQHAAADLLSEREYREIVRPLDLRILEAAQGATFNLLHLHGLHSAFDLVADYPVHAINWHDRDTPPTLGEGARRFPGLVVGGLSQRELIESSPAQIQALAADAIAQTNGRLCLSTGCVMQTTTPWGNIRALRAAVESKA